MFFIFLDERCLFVFFFFSSRRRHTRWTGDWSSDVCSSDLHVGGVEMVQKIQEGWLDFDAVVATPDTMKDVGRLGKILGPKGLMPNPKTGTVSFDVAKAVQEFKAGK